MHPKVNRKLRRAGNKPEQEGGKQPRPDAIGPVPAQFTRREIHGSGHG